MAEGTRLQKLESMIQNNRKEFLSAQKVNTDFQSQMQSQMQELQASIREELRKISEQISEQRRDALPPRIIGDANRRPPPRFFQASDGTSSSSSDSTSSNSVGHTGRYDFPVVNRKDESCESGKREKVNSPYSAPGQCSERRYNHPVFDRAIMNGEGVDNSRKETYNLSNFDGTGSVHGWILQCQWFFYFHNISEDDKSFTAGSYLEGKALKWLEYFMRNRVCWPSWKEFRDKLTDHFAIASYAIVEFSEVCEKEGQEVANLNSENGDVVEVFDNVLDQDSSSLQSQSSGSLNGEDDEIEVEILCNLDVKAPAHEELEAQDTKVYKPCDWQTGKLKECSSIELLEMTEIGSWCLQGGVAVKTGNAQMGIIIEDILLSHGFVYEVLTESIFRRASLHVLIMLKLLVKSINLIKGEVSRDFKRYKKKLGQSQDMLFLVLKFLHFYLFARFKLHACWFWPSVDRILLGGSFEGVYLLVCVECSVFVVLGADYARGGPDALRPTQMSDRKRREIELIVGDHRAHFKLLPFKQTLLTQRRARKPSLRLAVLVLVVEIIDKVVYRMKPHEGVENYEFLSHLLSNGEVAEVLMQFGSSFLLDYSLVPCSHLPRRCSNGNHQASAILDRKLHMTGNVAHGYGLNNHNAGYAMLLRKDQLLQQFSDFHP